MQLEELAARRLRPAPARPPRRQSVRYPPAAARRLSGLQRAARRRPRHRRRASRPTACSPRSRRCKGVKGRLEIAGEVRGALVVIDYAHKPDALVAALEALRPFAPGRLDVVFGCGGDRDKGKRPIMGQIAAEQGRHASSSPTTTRAARRRRPSAPRSWPARPARARSATGPRPSAPACAAARPRRCAADRRQGPRDRPDRRSQGAALLGSRGGAGRAGGGADPWLSRCGNGTSWSAAAGGPPRARPPCRITGFSIDTRTLAPGRRVRRPEGRARRPRVRRPAFKAGAAAAIVAQGYRAPAARRAAARRRSAARAGSHRPRRARSAPMPGSSPSPAASARPAPRRCCGCACGAAARRMPRRSPTTTTGACR